MPHFLDEIFQFAMLVPAAVLCYLPMRGRLTCSMRRTALQCLAMFVVLLPLMGALDMEFGERVSANVILLPLLVLLFVLYYRTLTTDLWKALTVYLSVCALLSFPSSFSYAFDAWLHPFSDYYHFSSAANFFQQAASVVLALIAAPFYARYFRKMVEELDSPAVWRTFLVLPIMFTAFNIFTIPHQYETLYMNRMFLIYLVFESATLLLMAFLYFLLYRICILILEQSRLEESARILAVQASQYEKLMDHIEQTRRIRHDFRHQIQTLRAMAQEGSLEDIRCFLEEYETSALPPAPKQYCQSSALNALFNYYGEMAENEKILCRWKIHLPDTLSIPEPELCSLLGNLLENAILGCRTTKAEERAFDLIIEPEHKEYLYIVSTNNFDGNVRQRHGRYLSTRHSGSGVGLSSIEATATRYGGTAHFTHTANEFRADVALKL